MILGERLRELREKKNLSQGDVQERSGLLRAYLSRVENGHTIPTIETLEKLAKALEIPIYQLFYEGSEPPQSLNLRVWKSPDENLWGSSGEDAVLLKQLRRLLPKIDDAKRKLILHLAGKMARPK